jgi:transcriptional regulator with XRE-family HTH domain
MILEPAIALQLVRLEDVTRMVGLALTEDVPDEADPLELRIGTRLRHTRLLNKLRLKDVAERANCSESMLSKIENDRAVPSLTTLHRLCKALNVSIAVLLNNEEKRAWTIMRSAGRPVIGYAQAPNGELTKAEVLVPYADGRLLEGFIVIIEPGGHSGGALQHKGEEVGYVIEGQLELTLDQTTYLLAAGDSFHFPSEVPHAYRNPGTVRMRAVWINTPPSF